MNDKAYDKKCINVVLEYYNKEGRHDLPWRKNITAYKILVSEVMLQQTQVSRVIDKFRLWNKAFPTLRKLRDASLTEVLLLWQGLGYQRRAKALMNIAKACEQLPKEYEELLMLPGVGPYTASAICAFAYDRFSHPVLETNIRTVLIEFFHQGEEGVHDGFLYDDLARLESYDVVRSLGARHFYYALMDFGAYLKREGISHNRKSKHYTVQSAYKGSFRELRAKVLFAITKGEPLPEDERIDEVLTVLEKENYIEKKKGRYVLQK
jgi:A/G-specific adenine glycosylase